MTEIAIQVFPSIKSSSPIQTVDLDGLVHMNQEPTELVRTTVDFLRTLEKGTKQYDDVKLTLPCLSINVRTKGGLGAKHIVGTNPLLYLDIDGVKKAELGSVKRDVVKMFPSIALVWTSAGGSGLSMVMRVEGLDKSNMGRLKGYFKGVNILGYKFDSKCFSLARRTFISYDPDIYVNMGANNFDWSLIPESINVIGAVQYNNQYNYNIIYNYYTNRIRWDNVDEYIEGDEEVRFVPEGVGIIKVEGSWNVKSGNRNAWLFNNLVRVKYLNPHLSIKFLLDIANGMNNTINENPMEESEVKQIVSNVFNGSYVPSPNVKRKILFNPDLNIPTKDKRSRCAKLIGAERTGKTLQKIRDAIEGYQGDQKITAKLISAISGLEVNNVKRKWKYFKEWVGELNAERRFI